MIGICWRRSRWKPRWTHAFAMVLALLATLSLGAEVRQAISQTNSQTDSQISAVPNWMAQAIWYQIFVERFRNGNAANDPTLADLEGAWPHLKPRNWRVTFWGHDWYRQEDWAVATGRPFYSTVQMRRYGGDLEGLLEKLDYLQRLGVTALYLNPINDSPSLHKYDARNYRHVDRNFGPSPQVDRQIVAGEDPTDPASWQWTHADRLFLKLIREVHRRGMRIIVDYSWNHTGVTFWAFEDVLRHQAASRYADWYAIERFDDPQTPENEFAYRGWAGVKELPEFKKFGSRRDARKQPLEGDLHPELKKHIFAVSKRWLDPNGDGQFDDGIDGLRLDVTEHLPLNFLREYKEFVAHVNPNAALIAELWWDQWPDRMLDPAPWIEGDTVHAIMNYRWYEPARRFFADIPPAETSRSFMAKLRDLEAGIPPQNLRAMMNVAATHDTPRLGTSLANRSKYKFRASPRLNPDYQIHRPNSDVIARQKMLLAQQFTWIGAPHIFYGDEVGMWGADDPDCRKPMIWSDVAHQAETARPEGGTRVPDPVVPNWKLFDYYRSLIAVRRAHARLFAHGQTELLEQENPRLLVYRRFLGDNQILVMLNQSGSPARSTVRIEREDLFRDLLVQSATFAVRRDRLTVAMQPYQARILVPNKRYGSSGNDAR